MQVNNVAPRSTFLPACISNLLDALGHLTGAVKIASEGIEDATRLGAAVLNESLEQQHEELMARRQKLLPIN